MSKESEGWIDLSTERPLLNDNYKVKIKGIEHNDVVGYFTGDIKCSAYWFTENVTHWYKTDRYINYFNQK